MTGPRPARQGILVTNDDGVASPALVPLADALDDLGTVHVVVPDTERSWTGKAMTRTGVVGTATTRRGSRVVTTVTGTPADATQVGCATLSPGPDLVVSGINLGHNHGSAFALSSGTVGAAVEAVLLGRRAVAVSTGTMDDDFAGWTRGAWSPAAASTWRRLAMTTRAVLGDVLASGLLDHAALVSVNLPWTADPSTGRRVTRMADTRYGAMLERLPGGEGWRPTYGGLRVPVPPPHELPTDLQAAADGWVSITPISLPRTPPIPEAVRAGVEAR